MFCGHASHRGVKSIDRRAILRCMTSWPCPRSTTARRLSSEDGAMKEESLFAAALEKGSRVRAACVSRPCVRRRPCPATAAGGVARRPRASRRHPRTRPSRRGHEQPRARPAACARTNLRRPLQASPEARRGGHGPGLGRRPDRSPCSAASPSRSSGPAWAPRTCSLASTGAAGAGADGPPEHRQGL